MNKHISAAVEINDRDHRNTVQLDPREYDAAVVGYIEDENGARLCYNVPKLIRIMMKHNDWDIDMAYEWFEYNVLRSMPYAKDEKSSIPVFLYEGK